MIIIDSKKIFFIHIPKCGGTTIRKLLAPVDDTFLNLKENEELLLKGNIDIAHLPLFSVEEFLPYIYQKILYYDTYALIRDPYERFASSLTQRIKMYKKLNLREMNKNELKIEIDEVIDYLRKNNTSNKLLDVEYIHFQKQKDYIYNKNQKIIKYIYTIEEIDQLIITLVEKINDKRVSYSFKAENQTLIYRFSFIKNFYKIAKNIKLNRAFNMLPSSFKKIFRNILYKKQDYSKKFTVFKSSYVLDFIKEYYREDIELYKKNNISK
ncbi:sulfotransferase family 2 domain-containing protein [Calditrichota bacterium LG25]